MRTTVHSYLDDFIARGPEIAFAYRRGLRMARWSYEQTARTAYQVARELEKRHITKGDRIIIRAEDSPEWVASFFGCLLRGAIVVPLDLQSDPAFIAKVQAQVSAKLALCGVDNRLPPELNLATLNLDELSALVAQHSSEPYAAEAILPGDTVEVVFTSGTTADPKGVRITHANLMTNLAPLENEIKRYLKWERLVHPVRFLNLVPLSHVFGQFMGMFVPQLLSGEVFFQSSLSPAQITDVVRRERISVIVAVPRILDLLRDRIEQRYEAEGKLKSFRKELEAAERTHVMLRWWKFRQIHRMFGWKFWAFISGGATLNPETERFWRRLGFAVIQGYGMTETAALISVNHPFKATRRSIGRLMPGTELKLADNGEILVRGENVSGYWDKEEHAEAVENEWFHTGDLAEMDEAGNLYFKGRKKEVIVTSAGVNIYPLDIETVLDRQPEIKASTVIELEGPHGPEPLAVLLLRNRHANAREIIGQVNGTLNQYQQLRHWFVWPDEDFPRTPTQKIRKPAVADRVRAELSGAPAFPAEGQEGSLAEIVTRISKDASVRLSPSVKLGTDLKLDSLARIELLSALEDRYQVEIDETAFTESTTVADVERIIRTGKHETSEPYPYPRWPQRWPFTWLRIVLLYVVAFTFVRLMGWPRINGKDRLRRLRGPVVFVCNHVTMVDHALVLFALPARFKTRMAIAQDGELLREWRYPPAGTGLGRRLLNLLKYFLVMLFFNVFPMPQKSGFRRSFSFAGELMDRGYNVMVFPEGKRTEHGGMNPFRVGAGLLIQQLDAPVVPMRIDGLWELKEENRHFARPGEVSVTIGEPITYDDQDREEQIVKDLEERVKQL
jgi:long-chain acyl-CoA synthetase